MGQPMKRQSQFFSCLILAFFLFQGLGFAESRLHSSSVILAQLPFEPPPQQNYPPGEEATPAPEQLTEQEQDRLNSLLPLLDGNQELWAMGEFVHFGSHSVPHLLKALKMPGARIRFNAAETLSMIKDPSAVPALVELALDLDEQSKVRAHALRVATRLDPNQVIPAIERMAKDPNSTIRNAAAFEARYVHRKEVLPILISVIPDPEQYVSITARDSFWILTRFSGAIHDWEISTPEKRKEWAKEWWAWWEENKSRFDDRSAPVPKSETPAKQEVS